MTISGIEPETFSTSKRRDNRYTIRSWSHLQNYGLHSGKRCYIMHEVTNANETAAFLQMSIHPIAVEILSGEAACMETWMMNSCSGRSNPARVALGPVWFPADLHVTFAVHLIASTGWGAYVVRLECSYIINLIEKYEMMCDKSLTLICALEVFRFLDQKPPLWNLFLFLCGDTFDDTWACPQGFTTPRFGFPQQNDESNLNLRPPGWYPNALPTEPQQHTVGDCPY